MGIEEKIDNSGLTQEQVAAIIRTIQLGRQLQTEHKRIADLYREGKSLSKIAEELDISFGYKVTPVIAKLAVGYAIRGYEGGFNLAGYKGLIDENERDAIRKQHYHDVGVRRAQELEQEGKGIFALTLEELSGFGKKAYAEGKGIFAFTSEERSKCGKKGGKKTQEKRVGIHGLTADERTEIAHRTLKSRGIVPFHTDELKVAQELSQSEEYRRGSNVNNLKIAERLNELYHYGKGIRNAKSVADALCTYRKSFQTKNDNKR